MIRAILGIAFILAGCASSSTGKGQLENSDDQLLCGDQVTTAYMPLLAGKRVGIVVNATSIIDSVSLLDTLLNSGIDVQTIFAPEHGFRGDADAGETISGGKDPQTGIPIVSLYGKNKKPQPDQLKGLDWVVFDIQDVGVRFYTYLSTLHYVMEACADQNIGVMVLDRPNPNGDYVDGPVLDLHFKSFVGMHPIPVVYGMTIGEMAQMINGEGWLKDHEKCRLKVILMKGYHRHRHYSLPIKPSPNLPNDVSVRLFPSLCFFEATRASIGRGTTFPFQVIGYPNPKYGSFTFMPHRIDGMAKYPKLMDQLCYGIDLRGSSTDVRFTLKYFINFYRQWSEKDSFVSRRKWFNLLAGTDQLLKQIESGMSESEIRQTWQPAITKFLERREKYLLYDD